MKISKAIGIARDSGPRDVIRAILLNAKNDEIFTVEELMELSGLSYSKTRHAVKYIIRDEETINSHKAGSRSFYGKNVAITQLKEGLIGKSERSH